MKVTNTPPNDWRMFLNVHNNIERDFADLSALLESGSFPKGKELENHVFEHGGANYKFLKIDDSEEHQYGWAIVIWNK